MILTCPSCGTQYVVKDGAIPPQGRQVRCASCKHSWLQNPEGTAAPYPADGELAATAEAPAEDGPTAETIADMADADQPDSLAEATLIEPRSGPEAEERAFEEASAGDVSPTGEAHEQGPPAGGFAGFGERSPPDEVAASPDWDESPQAPGDGDEFSPFPAFEDEAPRKRSGLVTLLIVLIVVAALAAAFWFLAPPQWKAMLGLGNAASPLALVTTHMDRQRLESGNELLTVTGRVINPTGSAQTVPPLQAQLKSRSGQIVYRWTIAPPARTLQPGASASFNSAEVNVPPGGEELTISLGTQKA